MGYPENLTAPFVIGNGIFSVEFPEISSNFKKDSGGATIDYIPFGGGM